MSSGRSDRKRKTVSAEESSESDCSSNNGRRNEKKYRVLDIDSDSESDNAIEIIRRKLLARPTDDAGPSSSGSSEIWKRTTGTQTTLPCDSASDSEFESDWTNEEKKEEKPTDIKPLIKSDPPTVSGDEHLEKCPICFLPFKAQEVGSPESCDHSFCINCILKWSQNMNTCPVDRQIFRFILVRSTYKGKMIKQIPIDCRRPQDVANEIVEEPTFCEICGSCEREYRMLFCDRCGRGFHLECLDPPRYDMPDGLWFCRGCELLGYENKHVSRRPRRSGPHSRNNI